MTNTLYEAFAFLESGRKDEGLKIIVNYLRENGLADYIYFVKGLIDVSFANGDTTFNTLFATIQNLTLGSPSFKVSDYVTTLEELLLTGRFESARIYINILRNAQKNGHILTDNEEDFQGYLDFQTTRLEICEKEKNRDDKSYS